MIRKEIDNISWLEFELLSSFKNLKHGVFLRHGGLSEGNFKSLNMGFQQKYPEENLVVKANREKVKKLLGFKHFHDPNLLHGNAVVEITQNNQFSRPECDAVTTQMKEIPLLITHADCQAGIFYDPIHQAIANVHAGWRGNVLDIYGHTVQFMKNRYGTSPQNLHVCISPSLGPQEAQFLNYKTELPETFWDYQVKPFYFDLWNITKDQLLKAGVMEHHIQIAAISTFTNPQDYFSFRRDKVCGRNGTFVSLIA